MVSRERFGSGVPSHDHEEAFWLGHVRVGLGVSAVVLCVLAIYLVLTPDGPHRELFWRMLGAGTVVTAGASLVPWRRVTARGWTLRVLYAWSASIIPLLMGVIWLDGGPASPVGLLLVLPLVFAAVAYPPRAVVCLGGAIVGGQLLIAWQSGDLLVDGPVRTPTYALIAAMCALTARNHARQVVQVRALAAELRRQADVDGLTDCFNHRAFHERLDSALELARSTEGRFVVIGCDLDHFKRINDQHGHPVGDTALRSVGDALRSQVRDHDVVARVGGEEFALLVSGIGLEDGMVLAERLRRAVGSIRVPVPLTASFGVAAYPATATSRRVLLDATDRALYTAKREGRDRSVPAIAVPPTGPEVTPRRPSRPAWIASG